MDATTRQIVEYTQQFSAAELTPPVLEAALNHLVDTVAVAIVGSGSEPATILAKLARAVRSDQGATVFGFGNKTSPELAALANAMMVRTYDWNDGMLARGGGHPSDTTSGILAAAEIAHASGIDFLVAMTLAYELLGGIGWEVQLNEKGFDQGTFMGAATALAVGKLWDLSAEQLANAASLAVVPNLPLGASRWGELSMMKGCTTAFAVRNGVFAAMLAREGFTSAPEPFSGIYGLEHVIGPFKPHLPVVPDGPRVVQMSHQKPIPADTQGLAILDLVPKIRAWASVDDIEAPDSAARHVGDEPKYDPRTRETADHSLPYMLAVALVDGAITMQSYRPERYLDPALRPVMRKIRVHSSAAMTEIHQTQLYGVTRPTPRRIAIRTRSGAQFNEDVNWHRGSYRNPLSRTDVNEKLDIICDGVIDDKQRELIRETWWNIADAKDVGDAVQTLTGFRRLP